MGGSTHESILLVHVKVGHHFTADEACKRSSELVPAGCGIVCLQVCWEHDDTAEDQMLQCDACRISVHMACYGVKSPPDGRLWLCNVCALGQPPCLPMCWQCTWQAAPHCCSVVCRLHMPHHGSKRPTHVCVIWQAWTSPVCRLSLHHSCTACDLMYVCLASATSRSQQV